MLIILLLQIVHKSQDPGGAWTEVQRVLSPQLDARFGQDVAILGDLNQDGCLEYLVGASKESVQGIAGCGALYVLSGLDGQVFRKHAGLAQADEFGNAVIALGDVNQDGLPEYGAVSWTNPGGVGARIFDGLTGQELHRVIAPLDSTSYYGYSGDAVGDWNLDGIPDYAVSDIMHDVNSLSRAGTVYVHSGLDGSLIQRLDGIGSNHHYGQTIKGGGDADGDGRADMLISSDGYLRELEVISGATGSMLYSLGGSYQFSLGEDMDFVPDLDGDGADELLIGMPYWGTDPDTSGEAFLYSGLTGAVIHHWVDASDDDNFGEAVACIGDLNHDGIHDWAIGSPSRNHPDHGGMVFFYSGSDGRLIHTIHSAPGEISYFGESLDGGADINGDGLLDALIADITHPINGAPTGGAAFLFSFEPFLDASERSISGSAGGVIQFDAEFPSSEAGLQYRLLASTDVLGGLRGSGKPWGELHGVKVPLVETTLLYRMWRGAPTVFTGADGTLDAQGRATVTLTLPSGAAAGEAGRTFRFAVVSFASNGHASASSAAVLLTIEP